MRLKDGTHLCCQRGVVHINVGDLVVRHGKSNRNVLRRARDLLLRSGSSMAGLVLNAVEINSPDYYGSYGYTGYSYGSMDAASWETEPAASAQAGAEGKVKR